MIFESLFMLVCFNLLAVKTHSTKRYFARWPLECDMTELNNAELINYFSSRAQQPMNVTTQTISKVTKKMKRRDMTIQKDFRLRLSLITSVCLKCLPCIVVDGASQCIPGATGQNADRYFYCLFPVRTLHQPINYLQEHNAENSRTHIGGHS